MICHGEQCTGAAAEAARWKQKYEQACETIRQLREINMGLRDQVDEVRMSPAAKQAAMEARERATGLIPYLDN